MISLDGDAIRINRLDLGLSQRSLAKATGLNTKSMSDIETNHHAAAEQTLLPLQRLVDTLGVPLRALLADDTPNGPDDTGANAPQAGPDDMAALGALLLNTRVNTLKTNLADDLGWTLDRLRLAAAALDHQLRPLGMQVHTLRGGYRLRPADGHRSKAKARADKTTGARNGLSIPEAELIHRALHGGMDTQKISVSQRPSLGRLLRQSVLAQQDVQAVPGPPLLDALDIPDDPAAAGDNNT